MPHDPSPIQLGYRSTFRYNHENVPLVSYIRWSQAGPKLQVVAEILYESDDQEGLPVIGACHIAIDLSDGTPVIDGPAICTEVGQVFPRGRRDWRFVFEMDDTG